VSRAARYTYHLAWRDIGWPPWRPPRCRGKCRAAGHHGLRSVLKLASKSAEQRTSMCTAHVRYSADPDDVSAQIDLVGVPWLVISDELSRAPAARRVGSPGGLATLHHHFDLRTHPRDRVVPGSGDIGDDNYRVVPGISVTGYRDTSSSASGWTRR
jgi:hypothetical protein